MTYLDGSTYQMVVYDTPTNLSPSMLEWFNSYTHGDITYKNGSNFTSRIGKKLTDEDLWNLCEKNEHKQNIKNYGK